jgi:putative hydrolase of the HAD superfamily
MRLRAVLFDIYGTLLSSAAGELHPNPALRDLIARAHAASPHPFPEVDIREIHAALHPNLAADEIEALAIDHERHANPVSPMPGAADTLRQFATRGIPLGLISNAQFYTVPILEETLGASLTELGIAPDLCCLSYLERRAKPDPYLFEVLRDRLADRGISAADAIHIGNDVRNDIDPARAAGFRTALFAGDPASLRLRGRSLDQSGADLVITDLRELPKVVQASGVPQDRPPYLHEVPSD